MRQPAGRNQVDAGGGDCPGGLGGDAAGSFRDRPAAGHRHRLPQLLERHVVEQDGIHADRENLFKLGQRVDLDLDLDEMAGVRFCALDRGSDIAGQRDVVVFDQNGVVEAKAVIAAMSKLQSQSTSNAASMVQRASIAALTGSQDCVAEFRADYIKLRDQVLAGFKTIPGLTCTVPQGAFYVYPNVSKFLGKGGIKSASDLAAKLLSEAHVVVVPGEAFGTMEHIRLSYAVSHDVVDEGVKRMREYFATLG